MATKDIEIRNCKACLEEKHVVTGDYLVWHNNDNVLRTVVFDDDTPDLFGENTTKPKKIGVESGKDSQRKLTTTAKGEFHYGFEECRHPIITGPHSIIVNQ